MCLKWIQAIRENGIRHMSPGKKNTPPNGNKPKVTDYNTLVFQTPFQDRHLNPQTSPVVRPLGVPNTSLPGIWRVLDV